MSLRRRVARRSQKKNDATLAPPAPISATLFEFAKPMMDSMPVPRRLAHMKAAMALATLAWNLPLLERDGDRALADEYRAMVDAELADKPALARALVATMMKARLVRWGHDDRLVASVEVVEDGKDIRILATESHVGERAPTT